MTASLVLLSHSHLFTQVFGNILQEKGEEPGADFQELVSDAFLKVDQELAEALQQGRSSGCTAIMAYLRKEGDKVKILKASRFSLANVMTQSALVTHLMYCHILSFHNDRECFTRGMSAMREQCYATRKRPFGSPMTTRVATVERRKESWM